MIKTFVIIALFICSQLALSKGPDEVIEGKKRAVLLITVHDKSTGKRIFEGGGFFVDNKGHFITNYHVIEDFLATPEKYQINFQDANGREFDDVEILKCRNDQKIDLCYGFIRATQKIYFIDVANKAPNKTQNIAIVGHNNSNYFSIRKGEVGDIVENSGERFKVPLNERKNVNVPMIELTKYDYPNGKCKGDSGCPVFDPYTGDLVGVFTECNTSTKTGAVHKLAIDSRSVYSFIGADSKLHYYKIPKDLIFKRMAAEANPEDQKFEKGREFEMEKQTGKIQ